MIPLGQWLPDQTQFNIAAAQDVINVLPSIGGYLPFPSFSPNASALTERPHGAASFRSKSGVVHNFAGTATKLYKMASDGLSYADVSRTVGGAYATAVDSWWRFAQYGDFVIASNGTDATQVFDMTAGGNFAALAGTPPISSFNGTVREFVVLAKKSTDYNAIQWSGIGNSTQWTASATTLSDSQVIPDGGVITGFVSGDYGVIFQERGIQVMTFQGPPVAFAFTKLSTTIGCWVENSIASHESDIFFLSHAGFYMVRGGSEISPIGTEKIDRWLLGNINSQYVYRCSSAIDQERKLYLFSFPSLASVDGTPDTILIYHWPTSQWSRVSVSVSMITVSAAQSTFTIDGLDAIAATIDDLVYPVDSLFYAGLGNLVLSGFNTSFQQGYFSGSSMAATVETGDVQLTDGGKTMLRGLRIMIEGDGVTPSITIKSRDRLQDTHVVGGAVAANSNGYCPLRVNARYHRAKITIPEGATWSRVTGIDDPKISIMGKR